MANCYNYGTISTISGSSNHAGAVVGWCRNSNVSMFKNNCWLDTSYSVAYNTTNISAVQKNLTQFKSGNVTYTLNGESPDGIWKQTIGTDFYPVLNGGTVYSGYACGSDSSEIAYANSTNGLLDTPSPNHTYTDGICYNGNCGTYEPCTGKGTAESPYIIKNTGNLLWFATQVNDGKTDIHGKVAADIDTKAVSKIGIGTNDNPYAGTFDGDLHTIKLALTSTENYTALFTYVNGATIKNLNASGTIATSHKFAASFIG